MNVDKLKFWLKFGFFIVPLAYLATFIYAILSSNNAGTFGDTFGVANAFFSGFALMMLIYAIILQREELVQVKAERDDTRKLLEGQENLNTSQEEYIQRQKFDSKIFLLVDMISKEKSRLMAQTIDLDGRPSQSIIASTHWYAARLIDGLPGWEQRIKELQGFPGTFFDCVGLCSLLHNAASMIDQEAALSQEERQHYYLIVSSALNREIAELWFCCAIMMKPTFGRRNVILDLGAQNLLEEDDRSKVVAFLNGDCDQRA